MSNALVMVGFVHYDSGAKRSLGSRWVLCPLLRVADAL